MRCPWLWIVVSAIATAALSLDRAAAQLPGNAPSPIVLSYRDSPIFFGPHEHRVTAVAFSPDGKTLATGADDGYLRIWDAADGRLKSQMGNDAMRGIQSLAFSPDGNRLATVGGIFGQEAIVWDAATGKIALEIADPAEIPPPTADAPTMIYKGKPILYHVLNAVAFSPDGKLFATAGDQVVLREADSGRQVGTLQHPAKGVVSLAFSPDGKTLATASADKEVRLWNVPGGDLEATFSGPQLTVNAVAISPDGQRVAAVTSGFSFPGGRGDLISGGSLWQWDRQTGESRKIGIGRRSGKSLAFVTPTRVLVGADRDVLLVDLKAEAADAPRKLWSHSQQVFAVAVSPDGRRVASASADRTVDVVEVSTEKLAYRLPGLNDVIVSVATSSDGKRFVTAASDRRLTNRTLAAEPAFAARYGEFFADESNSGRWQPSEVRLGSTADGLLQGKLPLPPCQVTAVACVPRRELAVVAGWIPDRGGMLSLWDLGALKPVHEFECGAGEVLSIAVSPDGQTLASGDADGAVLLWSIDSGAKVRDFPHDGRVEAVAWSADGKLLAAGDSMRTIRLYESTTGTVTRTLTSRSNLEALAFSPDGALLAAGTLEPGMELWDLRNEEPSQTLLASGDYFATTPGFIAFSPDGRFVVGNGHGKNIAVFDVAKRTLHCELAGHFHAPTAAAFLPDGRLLSGGEERTTRLWNVETAARLATWVSVPADAQQGWDDEWVGYEPAGRFAGSANLDRLRGWQIGGDVIGPEAAGVQRRVERLFSKDATSER